MPSCAPPVPATAQVTRNHIGRLPEHEVDIVRIPITTSATARTSLLNIFISF
jgi:hypothetical protein